MPCTNFQEIDVAEFAVDPRAPAWVDFRAHYPRCPECSREVARFATLKRALASEGESASAHPSEAELVALATPSARLAPVERVRLEAHLAGCAPCRTELAVAQRGLELPAVSAAPARPRWLEWLGGTLAPALRRPVFTAAAILLLAVPAAVLVWWRAQDSASTPGAPMARVEHGAPAAEVAKAPPPTPPAEEREPPGVLLTPPQAQPQPEERLAAREEPLVAKQPAVAKRAAQPPAERAAPEAKAPEPPAPVEIAALLPAESPIYAPGPLASAPSVRIGGAARSLGADVPTPEALGPAHVGATSRESPNLYWFLPEATSSPVEVTVVDPGAATPLLELTFSAPLAAGVHRVSLAEHSVRLAPGVDYRWFVALVRDPERRSQDAVSGAAIRYALPAPDQSARLSAAPPERAAYLYAESGYWYDAFDQLSSWLATDPGAALLRSHRAALLEQVGLGDSAAFERRGAGGGS